MAGQELNRP